MLNAHLEMIMGLNYEFNYESNLNPQEISYDIQLNGYRFERNTSKNKYQLLFLSFVSFSP